MYKYYQKLSPTTIKTPQSNSTQNKPKVEFGGVGEEEEEKTLQQTRLRLGKQSQTVGKCTGYNITYNIYTQTHVYKEIMNAPTKGKEQLYTSNTVFLMN